MACLPYGATYSEGTIGSTQSSWFTTSLVTSSSSNDGLVPPTVLSWNQLVIWLTEMDQMRMWLGEVVKTV